MQQPTQTPAHKGEGTGLQSSKVLAETDGQHKLFTLLTPGTHGTPNYTIVFSRAGNAVAYKAEQNREFYVVHNGTPGPHFQEVGDMTFSPNGERLAYVGQKDGKSRMVIDGKPSLYADGIGTPIFSPDSRHLLYYANFSGKYHLVVDGKPDQGSFSIYDQFFSTDSNKIISIEQADKDESSPYSVIKVRDLSLNLLKSKRLIASGRVYNQDRSKMAAITDVSGKKRVIEVNFDNLDSVKEGPLYDNVALISFGSDGATVAYVAERGGKHYLVMNNKETLLPTGDINEPPVVNSPKGEAAVIVGTTDGYDVCFVSAAGVQKKRYKEAAFLKFNKSGDAYAHVILSGKLQQYVVNGNAGPAFEKSLPPLFTPDGKHVVCRVRSDGKRFVVVLDLKGKEVQRHPSYEMIFEPVFTGDGKSVGYGVKEGSRLVWKVEKLP